jgi:dolichol-phosphate mannosyltransferase
VPSRFVPGGNDGGLSTFRKFVSWTARVMGQFALKKVRAITDPTSGFFLIKRKVIEGVQLKPIGWKILIEVIVRGHYDKVLEIPYAFQPRIAGTSNMSLKEQWNYIKHLFYLVTTSPQDRRMYLFAMVGVSGVLLNLLIYAVFVHAHMAVWVAGFSSGTLAMISNFILNDRLTWQDSRQGQWINRFLKYVLTSLIGIGINTIILSVLHYGFHMHYLVANLIGICFAMIWNFIVNNFWTWNMEKKKISVTISLGAKESTNFETLKG